MAWTSPTDLQAQLQKLWDKGALLAGLGAAPEVDPGLKPLFPLRLKLTTPSSTDLTTRFADVRTWANALRANALLYRIEEVEVRHREVGSQTLPAVVWFDTQDAAVSQLNKAAQIKKFIALVAITRQQQSALLPWLSKRPLAALALAKEWPRLLAVVGWLQAHPRPGIYLRQVDIAGVDSKFIETQRSVLAELLDLALPPEVIDLRATGVNQFARRYGFSDKPLRIRFRLFDGGAFGSDISITQDAFERLALPLTQVFITENEVNFLAFPALPGSMVVFGAGYGFEALAGAAWLQRCAVHYWGDIDTHGFAILDQLRATLPHAQSLLMDRATLSAHTALWGEEPQPLRRDLTRLTADESALFDDLRTHRFGGSSGKGVRLEQERIGFGWVQSALAAHG